MKLANALLVILAFHLYLTTSCYDETAPSFLTRLQTFAFSAGLHPEDISLYFYTQNTANTPFCTTLANFTGDVGTIFDPLLPTYIATHGITNNYNAMSTVKQRILQREEANVILVDWRHQAGMYYTLAVTLVPYVGTTLGDALKALCRHYNMPPSNLRLIGHSLGAHIMGALGAHLQGNPFYIIGLDPAAPLFQNEPPEMRLDVSDAQFVQVVHTNAGFLGMRRAIGHADYYPNGGGMDQPGCGMNLFGTCAHTRSKAYYEESITDGGFIAWSCESYANFQAGDCKDNPKSYFGQLQIDTKARGAYFLETNPTTPYAQGSITNPA